MVELRAEAVKEALKQPVVATRKAMDEALRIRTEAARAWLASQEQTPDITPEQIRRDVVASTCESIPEQVGGMEEVIEAQFRVREYALDYADALAALVGFHPQPEGDD